jgi:methyltransferase (TIGR00027 family)
MTPSKASKTAAQMALSRAIESREPTVQRVCFDPFAEQFLGAAYRMLLVARPLRASIVGIIEALFAGHHHYVVVRTRYVDDFLDQQLTPDVRQVVILGAGYDSRAYRFGDRLRQVAVFEVDHPATSRRKVLGVEKILGSVPRHVTYVPVDFDRDTVGARLEDAGYRSDLRTIFLWEGTTPYLSAEAVDETLRFVRARSASGSVLLFDYILRSVLDGTCTARGAQTERDRMKATSEPFVFGIDEDEIEEFLSARGFCHVRDAGGDALRTRYLRGDRDAYVKPWWRIVHASVS